MADNAYTTTGDSPDLNRPVLPGQGGAPAVAGDPYEAQNAADREQLRQAHSRNLSLALMATGLGILGGGRDRYGRPDFRRAIAEGGLMGLQTYQQGENTLADQQEKIATQRSMDQYRNAMLLDRQEQAKQHDREFITLDKERIERLANDQRVHSDNERDRAAAMAQHGQEFQQNQAVMAQYRGAMQANQQVMQQIQLANLASMNENRKFQQGIAMARTEDERQKAVDAVRANLTKQLVTISAARKSSTNIPGQNAAQLNALMNNYNAQAKNAGSLAKLYGIPHDPSEFKAYHLKDIDNHPFLKHLPLVGGAYAASTEFEEGAPESPTVGSAPPSTLGKAAVTGGGATGMEFKPGDRQMVRGKLRERGEDGVWRVVTP